MKFEQAEITLVPLCAYPAWNPKDPAFRQQDWVARYITLSVKGDVEKLKRGYITIKGKNFNINNYEVLVAAYCRWAAARLKELGHEKLVLVAVPNSNATPDAMTFGTKAIVERIAREFGPDCLPFSGVRFIEPMPKSRNGGGRDKSKLLAKMTLTTAVPKGEVVLFDDVCSSGAHLFAVQRLLAPRNVGFALSCGRTQNEPQPKMFNIDREKLSTYWWI